MTRRRVRSVCLLAAAMLLAASGSAAARDPGRWVMTGATSVPVTYWQGLTSDLAGRRIYFVGVFEGLWRTTPRMRQTAGVANAIPPDVKAREGYNHIGDPSYGRAEGGRILLPLECFVPGSQNPNPCGTGSIGVADPATLGWRYYVKLHPAEIQKAMWAEVSPDGNLVWTSSGNDLLAYRARDITAANAAPAGPPIRARRRLRGRVPASGITGAVFRDLRLFLAGENGFDRFQVWSLDPATGRRRLEIETRICGESEGLHVTRMLGGELHWLIAPFDQGCTLTYGPESGLLHFVPARGRRRLRVSARATSAVMGPRVRMAVRVTRRGRPVRRARVSFAGFGARTNRRGRATIEGSFARPGRYRVFARSGKLFGFSRFTRVELAPPTAR